MTTSPPAILDEASASPISPTQSPDLPPLAKIATASIAASLLAACGGGGGGDNTSTTVITPGSDLDAARFLLQAQFSASDSETASVRSLGYANWLNAQMDQTESGSGTNWLDTRGANIPLVNQNYYGSSVGDQMIWHQLMTNPQAVRQRLALALSEMFVVSMNGLDNFWPAYQIAGYWDMLTANVFGNFRNLLEAITLNPAMGSYLSTRSNKKENISTGRLPDENYAREIMQLFTIGLYRLNNDGTLQHDASGHPIETYTASDISNLARVFTGYSWDYTGVSYTAINSINVPSTEFTRTRMKLTASDHSMLTVKFLGTTIPANTDGATALKTALDTLFHHPNVGPFFAKQMIQRLVTSNPSPAYVGRVASAFANNGSGVRGDLKAVWRAILTDTEARTFPTPSTFGKVREPMIRFVQCARTFNASSATGEWKIYDTSASTSLNQSPLRSSSVFNFFRPGYIPPKTAMADQGLAAPEFQIFDESSTASYVNFMNSIINNGYGDVVPDYTPLLSLASLPASLLDWLNLHLAANQLGTASLNLIKSALPVLTSTATDASRLSVIKQAILLIMCSPEYLVQK